jgi:SAM-dependent methyltransferase
MNGVLKYINSDYFRGKTLLELGCGYADVGNDFYKLGANVTSSDARREHLGVVRERYPHIKTLFLDSDVDEIPQHYDIIVHWGLLYHLRNIETSLKHAAASCNVLLLETEVADSHDPNCLLSTWEQGYDQAYNKAGCRPSQALVERVLTQNGFKYKLINDPILNAEFHKYDWVVLNTGAWKSGLRRFWICWKGNDCPLQLY